MTLPPDPNNSGIRPTLDELVAHTIQQALDESDFATAAELADIASRVANRLKDPVRSREIAEISELVKQLKTQQEQFEAAVAQLQQTPDAPEVHRMAGIYLGLRESKWESAEAHISNTNDDQLKTLFLGITLADQSASEKAQLADQWWMWSESQTGIVNLQAKSVATELYAASLSDLSGLERKRAEERVTFSPPLDLRLRSAQPRRKSRIPAVATAPFDSRTAQALQEEWAEELSLPLQLPDVIGMRFELIPPGTFVMGSPADELGRQSNETEHVVTISAPFYMSAHEVTQAQYQAVMGTNPTTPEFRGPTLPVTEVTWYDCVDFCNRLNAIAELDNAFTFRLPSEAEWEYACRAGTNTAHIGGDTEHNLHPYAWYRGNGGKKNHAVGLKHSNAWGLYDMHGNVWEWCLDGFRTYTVNAEDIDPFGAIDQGQPRGVTGLPRLSGSPANCGKHGLFHSLSDLI